MKITNQEKERLREAAPELLEHLTFLITVIRQCEESPYYTLPGRITSAAGNAKDYLEDAGLLNQTTA